MKRNRVLSWSLLAAFALLVPGCLVLSDQRITLHYDAEADRLGILIHYEGIHHAPDEGGVLDHRKIESSRSKVARFVADGDSMLLDWYGHVQRREIRDAADDARTPPRAKELARLWVETAHSEILGHYRDGRGRICGAQLIVLPQASAFVALANRALDEAVLRGAADRDAAASDGERGPYHFTWRLWREAAQTGGHDWIAIDGHSLVFRVPVHPDEWMRGKLEFFREMHDKLASAAAAGDRDREFVRDATLGFLATAPLSIEQRAGMVVGRVGFADAPAPIRLSLRHGYLPNLEADVVKSAPADLDRRLAEVLLGGDAGAATAGIRALRAWGPPEDRVRAVVFVLHEGGDRAAAARRWLDDFGRAWNDDGHLPTAPAPRPGSERAAAVAAWRAWYGSITGQGSR